MAINDDIRHRHANGHVPDTTNGKPISGKNEITVPKPQDSNSWAQIRDLVVCAGGIYISFISWAILQERITTTNYGTVRNREVFKYPVVMNTVQSVFATILGYLYVLATRKSSSDLPIFPSKRIFWPLSMVAVVSAISSPFGYAGLQHVDYITFLLAKSCKLLPVMFLHVTLYRKKYPFYKYAVVALVTAGVAIFTLHQSSGSKKKGAAEGNSMYGLMLLGINLMFDGLTNSTQDDIYAKFKPYSGQQMMCALNAMGTVLQTAFLLLSPYLVQAGLGASLGMDMKSAGQLEEALAFIKRHPAVGWDIIGFAACGAMGQVFIFMTLSIFGSLFLVTVTVTRKMLSMIASVLYFGHSLNGMQWLGVGFVFGGIGMEALLTRREKKAKDKAKVAKEA